MVSGSAKVQRTVRRMVRLTALAAGAAVLASAAQASSAATIYRNAQVYTPSGWKTAFAVKDGRIVAVGSDAKVRKAAKGAREVDLGNRTVLPGLYDMHVHPVLQAKGGEGRCGISPDVPAAELLAGVSACVKAAAKGEWVAGGQWQASVLAGTPITAATLDAVSPDNPVMLFDVSGHSLWVNSRALAIAGIAKETPNPEGGIIERDAAGLPTGVLRETARDLVLRHIPPQPAEQTQAELKKNLDYLLSLGITGYVEAMAFRDDLEAYAALADRGELKQHVQACIAYSHAGHPNPDLDATIAAIPEYTRERFKPTCIKVFADGVPTESHTGAMLEAYQGGQPNAPAKGLLLFDPAKLGPLMAKWDRLGLNVLFHAAGDAAVRASLDAIAYARQQNGGDGPIHQVGHLTFIDPADLPRAKALHSAFEFSPYLWDPQPINDDITMAVGEPRISRVWPIREGFEAGALVIAGSDWAVIPAPDPWLGMETAVTRRNRGGGDRSFGLDEAITIEQAVRMFTINAATRLGLDKDLGTIETGKRADFIVIDRNPFRIPATEIHTIKVQQTYIDGEVVFDRQANGGR
ncbi:amidohydrolase [Sphingosinicella microcystinivorans]|uniref:amidohydrolase n=1 Tax=Sphingosinicella microcystinivorans TaxID=335406 RepID=UPI0022F3FA61|nr:amidohydrolase [Sphingosinicella microcystinivorans]WBX86084.1 amidohydrolase [Sphingosinicella microcystinivorans]